MKIGFDIQPVNILGRTANFAEVDQFNDLPFTYRLNLFEKNGEEKSHVLTVTSGAYIRKEQWDAWSDEAEEDIIPQWVASNHDLTLV